MTRNMGTIDRVIRAIIGVVLLWWAFSAGAAGLWFWLALVVGAVMLITAAVGNCPLYSLIGIRTCRAAPGK